MINTKQKLLEYIKQELGNDVIEIEVSDNQINNQINKTIQKFCKYSFEGQEDVILILELKKNIQKYTLPIKLLAIYEILETSLTSSNVFNDIGIYARNIIKNFIFSEQNGLQYYIVGMQYIDLIKNLFKHKYIYDFISSENTITFKNTIKEDKTIAILCVKPLITEEDLENPNFTSNLFNHEWIKEYATELTRYMWGTNLNKYQTTLIGGTSINSDFIVNEAKEKLEKLEEDLFQKYDPPMYFFEG